LLTEIGNNLRVYTRALCALYCTSSE